MTPFNSYPTRLFGSRADLTTITLLHYFRLKVPIYSVSSQEMFLVQFISIKEF
jgi:hypothetical protein